MKHSRPKKKPDRITSPDGRAGSGAFFSTVALLVCVPLVFSTSVHHIYVTPRFALLLVGSSIILVFLAGMIADRFQRGEIVMLLRSKHVGLVLSFIGVVALSTLLGEAPWASAFGSLESRMGLITRFCFLVCFVGLIVGVGKSRARFQVALWAMVVTGFAAAAYATSQFFGYDPFVSPSLYTFESPAGSVIRVGGPAGHSNYLGNFLLYTTLLGAGVAVSKTGWTRRITTAGIATSVAAVTFTGTRGAWLGLLVGAIAFGVLESRRALKGLKSAISGRALLWGGAVLVLFLLFVWVLLPIPASRGVVARARLSFSEGFTGSGRTLLWRDSLTMVTDYAVIGSGPEAFRKAFLPYKSPELARLAPQANNESPHNSYIDAATSFGLAGAALYAAIICSALSLIAGARRRAPAGRRSILTGLLCSLAAVTAHNFFIFDQIPTGLYFFSAAALALSARNVFSEERRPDSVRLEMPPAQASSEWRSAAVSWAPVAVACATAVAASWYALASLRSDNQIKRAFASAEAGDFEGLMWAGRAATAAPDPTRGHSFLFAQALALYAHAVDGIEGHEVRRQRAIRLGIEHAKGSVERTLAHDSVNLLIAHLASAGGDWEAARAHAEEALRWDPYYANSNSLLAASLLALGEREKAAQAARLALDINPSLVHARLVLERALGDEIAIERMLQRGRHLIASGRLEKAARVLRRALRLFEGQCNECHRELASIYEAGGQFENAITELEAYRSTLGDRDASQVEAQIKSLMRRQNLNYSPPRPQPAARSGKRGESSQSN